MASLLKKPGRAQLGPGGQCLVFGRAHVGRRSAELQTPCEFVLLNPLASGGVLEEGVDFQRVDPSRGGVEEQLETLGLMLRRTG